MYPHERSLVQKMEGKPFALVGVNSLIARGLALAIPSGAVVDFLGTLGRRVARA